MYDFFSYRYISPDCPYPIDLPTAATQDIIQKICTENGLLDLTCFNEAQVKVVETIEREYFPEFLLSEGHAKHVIDVLTGDKLAVRDIFKYDELLFHFMEFVDAEGDRDLIEFWMSAGNFRNRDPESDPHFKSDAVAIYDRFISPMQASSPLGLGAKMRAGVEEAICGESGRVSPACFDPVVALVLRVLQKRHLPAFLQSSLFRKHLNELFCRVQTSPFSVKQQQQAGRSRRTSSTTAATTTTTGTRRMKRSGSNSSLSTNCSDVSTQNTLLAAASVTPPKSKADPAAGVDLDPDSLWRRKRHSVVNIGRIDELGRYQSSFEKPPTAQGKKKSAESTVKIVPQAIRRLVSSDVDKMQEEMAWNMASMIVADTMSLTKGNNSNNNGC